MVKVTDDRTETQEITQLRVPKTEKDRKRSCKSMPSVHKNGISRRLRIQHFSLLSKVPILTKMGLTLKKVGLYVSLLKYLKIPVWQNQRRSSPKPDAANRDLNIMDGFIHAAFESAALGSHDLRSGRADYVVNSDAGLRQQQGNIQDVDEIDDGGNIQNDGYFNNAPNNISLVAERNILLTRNGLHVGERFTGMVTKKDSFMNVTMPEMIRANVTLETETDTEAFTAKQNDTSAVVEEGPTEEAANHLELFLPNPLHIPAAEGTFAENTHSVDCVLCQPPLFDEDVSTGELYAANDLSLFSFNHLDTVSQEEVLTQDRDHFENPPLLEPVSDSDEVSLAYLAELSVELRNFTDRDHADYIDPERGQNRTLGYGSMLHVREGNILVNEELDSVEYTDISIRDYADPFRAADVVAIRQGYTLVHVEESDSNEYADISIR